MKHEMEVPLPPYLVPGVPGTVLFAEEPEESRSTY